MPAQVDTLPAEVARLETEVTTLEADYRARSRLACPTANWPQARRRLATVRKKLADLPERLRRAEQVTVAHHQSLDQLQAKHTALKAHQTQLEADNTANPKPVVMVARLDAGFRIGPNVAWLIEMGLLVYTKAYNPKWRPGSRTRCRRMPAGRA